ncbi:hypothetical protein U9M48_005649 [Paspalum notatum var. saurae]|uniref:Uncharacterized protein n=1 Tax=Paspalum notatum var. saurae TaxID=547442 RepID=A0AAQ3PW40_PASNO
MQKEQEERDKLREKREMKAGVLPDLEEKNWSHQPDAQEDWSAGEARGHGGRPEREGVRWRERSFGRCGGLYPPEPGRGAPSLSARGEDVAGDDDGLEHRPTRRGSFSVVAHAGRMRPPTTTDTRMRRDELESDTR